MISILRAAVSLLAMLAAAGSGHAAALAADYVRPGPREATAVEVELTDPGRNRRIPLRLYVPAGSDRVPVVLFSHGLGGSRAGGRAWGEHWASHGFLSIHVQHPGSDEEIMRGGAKGQGRSAVKDAMTPRAFLDRVDDVRFLIDVLERAPERIHREAARAEARRIGMSGHSYGARTTLALAGERIPFYSGELVEPRIAAAIAFSPYAPPPRELWARRFGAIRMPVLNVTGTLDRDVILGETPEARREPFRHMPPGDKYLLVLTGADHMVFNGHGGLRGGLSRVEVGIHDHVRAITTAFWAAYLRDDAAAKAWLAGDGARVALKGAGTLETK